MELDLQEDWNGVEVKCERRSKAKKRKRTSVVDLATGRIDRFQQLIDFVVTHFLAEIGQNYSPMLAFYIFRFHTRKSVHLE